jgi:hypothetical protein
VDSNEREILIADVMAIRLMTDSILMRLMGLSSLEVEDVIQDAEEATRDEPRPFSTLREAILDRDDTEDSEGGDLETGKCPYGDPYTCPRAQESHISTSTFTKPQHSWYCKSCGYSHEGN